MHASGGLFGECVCAFIAKNARIIILPQRMEMMNLTLEVRNWPEKYNFCKISYSFKFDKRRWRSDRRRVPMTNIFQNLYVFGQFHTSKVRFIFSGRIYTLTDTEPSNNRKYWWCCDTIHPYIENDSCLTTYLLSLGRKLNNTKGLRVAAYCIDFKWWH